MKRKQRMKLSELWDLLQGTGNEILLPANTSDERRLASLDSIADLPANIAVFVEQYKEGDYRTILRNLDAASDGLAWGAILRILCLLKMAENGEKVGETDAIELLRDRVLPQDKQTIQETEIPALQRSCIWLERFCLGYEPPKEFWEATYG
ncbi:MAG: hypothetical protein WHX52_20810 [Anaerolineae bacterium]